MGGRPLDDESDAAAPRVVGLLPQTDTLAIAPTRVDRARPVEVNPERVLRKGVEVILGLGDGPDHIGRAAEAELDVGLTGARPTQGPRHLPQLAERIDVEIL